MTRAAGRWTGGTPGDGELEKPVYFAAADLLILDAVLLLFDTTSTYFELGDADEEGARNWRGEKTGGEDADPDTKERCIS